jgi:hypothetical protein
VRERGIRPQPDQDRDPGQLTTRNQPSATARTWPGFSPGLFQVEVDRHLAAKTWCPCVILREALACRSRGPTLAGRWVMRRQAGMTRLDRPWLRPGAVGYALAGVARPPVEVCNGWPPYCPGPEYRR